MPLDLTPYKPPYYDIGTGTGINPTAIIGTSYIARIAQTGTNDPTAVVDTNNQITGITYARSGIGAYFINAPDDTFPINKTWIILGPCNSPFSGAYVRCYQNGTEQLTLESYLPGEIAGDGIIIDMTILIIVTP